MALKIPKFSSNDINFLQGYAEVIKPLEIALDKMQAEKNKYFGCVLPRITKVKISLLNIKIPSVQPLKEAVLAGVKKRFGSYFENDELIISACVHPKFKLNWIQQMDNGSKIDLGMRKISIARKLNRPCP